MYVQLRAMALAVAASCVASNALAADLWHIKCFEEDGHTIAVRAIAADGSTYPVKAIPGPDPEFMDVEAVEPKLGTRIPVKVLPSPGDGPRPVKAIARGDLILPIKGITSRGESIDVKAFFDPDLSRYDIKCVSPEGRRLGLKAISSTGRVFDVKGFKNLPGEKTLRITIEAHIQARPQR